MTPSHVLMHAHQIIKQLKSHTNGIHKTQIQILSTPLNTFYHMSYHYSLS